jgi:hypothetical protein
VQEHVQGLVGAAFQAIVPLLKRAIGENTQPPG